MSTLYFLYCHPSIQPSFMYKDIVYTVLRIYAIYTGFLKLSLVSLYCSCTYTCTYYAKYGTRLG
jgi:hypothetical protein